MILLRTLGDCTIEIGEKRLAPDSEILFSLLAYLIVERGHPIPRSVLLEFFWGDEEDSKARHCLRQSIYKLRQMGVPIETRHDRYFLPECSATLDIDLLARALGPNGIDSHMLVVLPGYAPATSPSHREWTERLREKGQHAIRTKLLRCIAAARKHNNWEVAGQLAKQCLTIDALNEEATLTLAEAMALSGNKRAAVNLLNTYADELGSDAQDLRVQASVLRTRISERITYAPAVAQIPLIGRAESMATLARIARLVSRGEGKTVVVHGEAGIGKSRLASELVNVAALEGFLIARVCCRMTTRERALALYMELSPQLLRLPGALGCSPEALGLVRRLCQHETSKEAETDRDDPTALHTNIRAAVRDLIDAIASERPLVLLIEDAHWIDEISLSALREIAVSNADRPLFLLITSRLDKIDELTTLLDLPATLFHALPRLTDDAAAKLAQHLCGAKSESPSQPMVEWCVKHGSGNPLLITELVNHWQHSRDTDHIPVSLESLIRHRVDALSPSALRLLQAVALLGNLATHERLHAIIKCPHWEMLSAIEELERSGVATSSSSHLQPRHELIARAAQESLTPLGLQLLHLAIAESLELHSREPKETAMMWDAATHWSAGGNKHHAVALAIECASHLLRIGLPYDAGQLLKKALVFADSDTARLGIYTHRAVALRRGGAWQELLENSEDALAMVHADSDTKAAVHSQHEIDNYAAHYGRQTISRGNVIQRALRCVEDTTATSIHRLRAAAWGLVACYADCQRENATRFMQQLSTIEAQTQTDAREALLCSLVYHLEFGDLQEALRAGDSLLSAAEESTDPANIAFALRVSSYPYRFLGDFELVDKRIRRSVSIAEEHHLVASLREALVLTAQHCCNTGEYERAWSSIQMVESQLSGRRGPLQLNFLQVGAEIALMRHDLLKAACYLAQLSEYQPDCARFDSDCLALLVMYEVAIGNTPPADHVEKLWRRHQVLRGVGGQEFPTATLCIALTMRGEESRSRQIAEDYATRFRRERFPISNRILLDLLAT